MNRTWLVWILTISFALLTVLKHHELSALSPFFKADRTIKIKKFGEAKNGLSPSDQELLELWESMLTGRVAPLSKSIREQYKKLGLNHLFTPSGFHLSALLTPLSKIIRGHFPQMILLGLIGFGLIFLPGQSALKRMVLIKFSQKNLGLKIGFILALLLDVFFGSFQDGALGFTYSFLFLGIIYSGLRGISLIMWFFLAQMLLAFFQGLQISPLLIIVSPLINLSFGISMPFLFVLAFPLWDWQLHTGLYILRFLHSLVELSIPILKFFPVWEVSIVTLILALLFLTKNWKPFLVGLFLFSYSLNPDFQKEPSLGSHEFKPQGEISKIVLAEKEDKIYFSDGRCSRKLVRGLWWEKCSPRRRSTGRKLKKLSYPS